MAKHSVRIGTDIMDLDVVIDGDTEDRLKREVEQWLIENCKGTWEFKQMVGIREITFEESGGMMDRFPLINTVEFTDENDAFAFKMRWY